MPGGSGSKRITGLLLSCVILAVWAVTLRPVSLGGPAGYVIVDGASMEPTYDHHDLVITRKTGRYADGDIIAYYPSTAATERARLTIHRVIGVDADGDFLTQGDNRPVPDQWVARPEHVVGEAWLHIPAVGGAILWLREPLHFRFALAGLLAVSFVGGKRQANRRRRFRLDSDGVVTRARRPAASERSAISAAGIALGGLMALESTQTRVRAFLKRASGRDDAAGPQDGPQQPRPPFSGDRIAVAAALIALLVVSAFLTVLGFRHPTQVDVENVEPRYEHVGAFSYQVAMEPSTIYPDGLIGPVTAPAPLDPIADAPAQAEDTDEESASTPPIYLKIARTFTLDLAYDLVTVQTEDVSGNYRALLTIRAGADGWETTREIVPPTPFSGASTNIEMAIDLQALQADVLQIEEETGFRPSDYLLTLQPEIELRGMVGNQVLLDTYQPSFTLTMDTIEIEPGNEFEQRELRTATTVTQVGNVLTLPGMQLSVQRARTFGPPGLALALLGLSALGYLELRRLLGNEDEMIRARHGGLLVAVDSDDMTRDDRGCIRVTSIQDLVRIAEREGQIIFQHEFEPGSYRYFVRDGAAVYEYSRASTDPNGDDDSSGRATTSMRWAVDDLPGMDD